MSTYTKAQKDWYEKNKHLILARTRKYKKEYNKMYYKKNRAKLIARTKAWRKALKTKLDVAVEESFKES